MRHLSAYTKYAHYLRKYSTKKKLLNMMLNKYEMANKKIRLKSRPYKITIDPGNFCNLRCPGCHTGIKHPEMIKPSFMKYDNYKIVFDKLSDYATSVALYNWGEPFLNKQIFDIISYTHENGAGTTIHSNFNVFDEEMAENAVKSGLTHIYLSIDGASQDGYAAYRVKGNLDNVMENLRIMLETRKRMESKFPIITWKFLEFSHNAHEVEDARKRAKLMGVDAFETFVGRPKLTDIYDEAEAYKNKSLSKKESVGKCPSLWASIYVGADGSVLPCSLAYRSNEVFGSLIDHELEEVWNNEKYLDSRKMFSGQFDPNSVPLPCRACKFAYICGINQN